MARTWRPPRRPWGYVPDDRRSCPNCGHTLHPTMKGAVAEENPEDPLAEMVCDYCGHTEEAPE